MGVCGDHGYSSDRKMTRRRSTLAVSDGNISKQTRRFSIPLDLVRPFVKSWIAGGRSKLSLAISPVVPSSDSILEGTMYVEPPGFDEFKKGSPNGLTTKFDVTCRDPVGSTTKNDPFVVQVVVRMSLVDSKHLSLAIAFEPRAVIENKMPVSIHLRTPMPHTFSLSDRDNTAGKHVTYKLPPDAQVEVFTPGPSIAVTSKTADTPVAGTPTSWMDGGWIDLPLASEFRLPEPLACILPFSNSQSFDPTAPSGTRGSEFFIAEDSNMLAGLPNFFGSQGQYKANPGSGIGSSSNLGGVEVLAPSGIGESIKKFFITVCYYAVDHTGDLLFEQDVESSSHKRLSIGGASRRPKSGPEPFSVFSSPRHQRRITLLPGSTIPLRLMQLTMDGDEGFKRSLVRPFVKELGVDVECMLTVFSSPLSLS